MPSAGEWDVQPLPCRRGITVSAPCGLGPRSRALTDRSLLPCTPNRFGVLSVSFNSEHVSNFLKNPPWLQNPCWDQGERAWPMKGLRICGRAWAGLLAAGLGFSAHGGPWWPPVVASRDLHAVAVGGHPPAVCSELLSRPLVLKERKPDSLRPLTPPRTSV